MKKVLIAGATGYLGQHVVKEFKKRNYWVRVLIRKESQKEKFEGVNVDDFFVGQITKPETLKNITKDIDWVFTTIGITRQKDGMSYMDVDYQGNLNLLQEAENSNVTHFSYVSALYFEEFESLKIMHAKEKFVGALKKSKIKSSIFRPSGFFVDMREILVMGKSNRIFLFGTGEYRLNPISGRDLAKVCVDSIEQKLEEINVGGPKIYSQNQIAEIAFNALGTKGKVYHIPLWIRDMVLFLIRTFTSPKFYGPYEFFLTAMSMEMITDKYGNDLLEDFYNQEAKHI